MIFQDTLWFGEIAGGVGFFIRGGWARDNYSLPVAEGVGTGVVCRSRRSADLVRIRVVRGLQTCRYAIVDEDVVVVVC